MRARWWIGGTFLVGLVVSVPLARAVAPYEYLARASFLWERPPEDQDPAGEARALRTMVDSVELPTNLAEVRRRLKIHKTLPEIGASVQVTTEEGSNLVLVTARDDTAQRAAKVANTLVEVFLERRRMYEEDRRRDTVRTLATDLAQARRRLDEARRRYDAFRSEHHITDLSLDTQRAIETAATLRAAADLARADASAEEARAKALREQAKRLPRSTVREVPLETPTGPSPERQRYEQARSELVEARARLGPDHPDLRALEARVEALQAEVARTTKVPATPETSRIVTPNGQWETLQGTLADAEAQRAVSLQRSRNLQELQAAARERLQQLSAVEGEASSLLAAQRVAETHVLELADLQARAVDAARSESTGLRFVARATPPDGPESRGKQRAILVLLPILATFVVIAIVLGRTLRGLKVCTATELAYWGGGPVVGSSTWPRDPESLLIMVEELDDLYPHAAGTTLVVGATPDDDEAARQVAAVMAETQVEIGRDPEPDGDQGPIEQPESRTALARVGKSKELAVTGESKPGDRVITGWSGEPSGPSLRRAARLADRVLVVVRSGTLTPPEVARIRTRLGAEDNLGYLVVGIDPEHEELPDRAGAVERFWKQRRGE